MRRELLALSFFVAFAITTHHTALIDLPFMTGIKAAFLCMRGDSYYKKSDYDRAIAYYSQLIDMCKNNDIDNRSGIKTSSGIYHHAIFSRAHAYFKLGEKGYDNSIADYTESIRIEPSNAAAYNNRGWTYALKGDFDLAIIDATISLELRPNNPATLDTRGFALSGKGEYDLAIADFEKALQIDPDHAPSKEHLGETLRLRGK